MADQQLPSFGSLPLAGASETTNEMPEALQAPTRHVSMPFVFTLSFAQMAIYMSFIPTISIMLPLQVQGLDAANKIAVLGVINAVGALVALVANPLLTLTHSYLVLFVLAGVATLIGSFIVQPIKSVR